MPLLLGIFLNATEKQKGILKSRKMMFDLASSSSRYEFEMAVEGRMQ
jgi:hypothetical protein